MASRTDVTLSCWTLKTMQLQLQLQVVVIMKIVIVMMLVFRGDLVWLSKCEFNVVITLAV